jgi:uncharacterized protein YbjT (DUF2867 family)
LTDPRPRNRTLEIGGPGNYTNTQIAEIYGELAGLRPRVKRMPRSMSRILGQIVRPFHPGWGRIILRSGLPDDAFDEVFDPFEMLGEFPMDLLTLEEFVGQRVAEVRQKGT